MAGTVRGIGQRNEGWLVRQLADNQPRINRAKVGEARGDPSCACSTGIQINSDARRIENTARDNVYSLRKRSNVRCVNDVLRIAIVIPRIPPSLMSPSSPSFLCLSPKKFPRDNKDYPKEDCSYLAPCEAHDVLIIV